MYKAITNIVQNSLSTHQDKKILSFFYDEELSKLIYNIDIPENYVKNIRSKNNIRLIKEVFSTDNYHYVLGVYGIAKEECRTLSGLYHSNLIMIFPAKINDDMSNRQKKFLNNTCGNFNIVQNEQEKMYFDDSDNVFSLEKDGSLSAIIELIISKNKVFVLR